MTTLLQDGPTVRATDGPTPEDIEAAIDLPRDAIGRVVSDYHEACRRLDRAEELATMDPALGPWVALEAAAIASAERMILRAIRAAATAAGSPGARGLVHEGMTFLAVDAGDDPDAWALAVAPGGVLGAARSFRPGMAPPPAMGAPTERPAWLARALAEVERLGHDEARRRVFGIVSDPRPDGWSEALPLLFREWGRRETFRLLGLA